VTNAAERRGIERKLFSRGDNVFDQKKETMKTHDSIAEPTATNFRHSCESELVDKAGLFGRALSIKFK
jgi:hypothetical protein